MLRGVTADASNSPARSAAANSVVASGRIVFAEELNKNRLANHEAISVGKERA